MKQFSQYLSQTLRRLALYTSASVIVAVGVIPLIQSSSNVYAAGDTCNKNDYYSGNDILFYSACATEDTCTLTSSATGAGNLDYKSRAIFNDKSLGLIEKNKPFYVKAADKAGIPWQMIAVIHYRETALGRTNPANGQGIYQDYARSNGPYPPGEVTDSEFQRQTDWAASFLLSKAGSKKSALRNGDADAVKYTFFSYNGRAGVYIKQAKNLGFDDTQANNGEGSPYVMNIADERRDPGVNTTTWGQIKTDGGSLSYPANSDYGAFVMYAALAGGLTSSANCSGGGPVLEGGLTEAQAKKFVINYGANKGGISEKIAGALWPMCNGGGSNCVTFSYFFNHGFTDLPAAPNDGNGVRIVSSLKAKGAKTGTVPKPFATFSHGAGSSAGHTGIVLGVHGDTVIVGQASCSSPGIGAGDGITQGLGSAVIVVGKKNDPRVYWGAVPTEFAYPDKVDTQAIEKFIGS
jgi:hypothetical protein